MALRPHHSHEPYAGALPGNDWFCLSAQSSDARYFRQVELIVAAPARPGGFVVQWSTDAFNVLDNKHRMHGKCGIETFARWAQVQIN